MGALGPALVAIGAVLGVLYVLWRPHWAFVMVLAMYPMEQLLQSSIPWLRANGIVFNFAVGGLAIFAVITGFVRGRPVFAGYLNRMALVLLAFYALIWVGVVYSPVPELAGPRMLQSIPYWALSAAILPLLLVDTWDLRYMLRGYLLLGTLLAILIMINPNTGWAGGRLRMELGMNVLGRVYSNPLTMGTLGGMIVLIAILLQPERNSLFSMGLRATAFMTGLSLAVGSGSRGQVLGVALTGVVCYPLARQVANPRQFFAKALGLGFLVTVGVLVFRMNIGDANAMRWSVDHLGDATSSRFLHVTALLGPWSQSPAHYLFGLGTQAFTAVSPDPGRIPYVHNLAAESLGEHGLVGFGVYCTLVFMAFITLRQWWLNYRHDAVMRSVVASFIACCFLAWVLSFKQGSLIGQPTPFYWWLIAAKIVTFETFAYGRRDWGEAYARELSEAEAGGYDEAHEEYDEYAEAAPV